MLPLKESSSALKEMFLKSASNLSCRRVSSAQLLLHIQLVFLMPTLLGPQRRPFPLQLHDVLAQPRLFILQRCDGEVLVILPDSNLFIQTSPQVFPFLRLSFQFFLMHLPLLLLPLQPQNLPLLLFQLGPKGITEMSKMLHQFVMLLSVTLLQRLHLQGHSCHL
ncbi:hypothetical protein E2C01_052339 [Portunus trituberculatus]|uniref:Uncharacterized protein n=1 Tax=Portunus trituberculatus TaxID=210409 RepID=A0A5B7GEB4_PORTR|nr:hypothetical protein [Portunus trituberculatus]